MSKYDLPLEYYKGILDKVHAGVFINQIEDLNDFSTGSNVYINNYCITTAGYSLAEFETMGQEFFVRIMEPEDVQSAIDSIIYLTANPESSYSGFSRIIHKDGHLIIQYSTCRVFKMRNGVPWQFINVSFDINDEIKTDAQLEKLMKENAMLKNQLKCTAISTREKEIIKEIVKGKTDLEIATILFISPKTASTHRKNIIKKLELANTADLVRFAVECGLY
jgi:DNA-binding CsgD family transcriptional regulator